MKPFISYRSLPVDQTFHSFGDDDKVCACGGVAVVVGSKSGNLNYLGVFKISELPTLANCRCCLHVSIQFKLLDVKLLCTLSITLLLSRICSKSGSVHIIK